MYVTRLDAMRSSFARVTLDTYCCCHSPILSLPYALEVRGERLEAVVPNEFCDFCSLRRKHTTPVTLVLYDGGLYALFKDAVAYMLVLIPETTLDGRILTHPLAALHYARFDINDIINSLASAVASPDDDQARAAFRNILSLAEWECGSRARIYVRY